MNNANKKIALISDYFNLYLITLFIIFIKPKLFSGYHKAKSTKKRPVIKDKLGVIELDNILINCLF